MRILIDIGHPAHVHFFKNPMRLLRENGHEILVTSRVKEIAVELLDDLGIEHQTLSELGGGGMLSLLKELAIRDCRLYQVVRKFRPDIMAGIGGIFIAHVGAVSRIPSLVFYDTENATLQNALTYPLASCVLTPGCYQAWLPDKRHIRYAGYHELSYLHPNYFVPDRAIAIANGLSAQGDTFLLRLVSWQANHDIGENGWNQALLERVIMELKKSGDVLISSEMPLPESLSAYQYRGNPAELHHVMAFCRGFVGESATMASECAVLGVPSIYAAETGRGYTDEQEQRFDLVRNVKHLTWEHLSPEIQWLLSIKKEEAESRRQVLLSETIDVAAFVANTIETFPTPLREYHTRVGA